MLQSKYRTGAERNKLLGKDISEQMMSCRHLGCQMEELERQRNNPINFTVLTGKGIDLIMSLSKILYFYGVRNKKYPFVRELGALLASISDKLKVGVPLAFILDKFHS